tara:strand:+ start:4676 stop:5374 length:699 start_codon:yes stop_codon:yes gene_type:complete
MSYTFGKEGGTTFGMLDWNDIFSPNTTIPWDDILKDLDTVICRIPYTITNNLGTVNMVAHRLLTNFKIYGYNHWLGDGITLGLNVSTHDFIPGEPARISSTAAPGGTFANVRACFERPSGTPSANDVTLGICLETVPAFNSSDFTGNYASVLVTGVCPGLRDNGSTAMDFGEALFVDTDFIGGKTRGCFKTAANAGGQVGRPLSLDTDIIINSSGDAVDGCTVLLLNKSEVW